MQTSVKERGVTSLLSILKLREYSKEIFYLTKFRCCLSSIRNFKNVLKQIYHYTWCIYDIRYHSNSCCMLSTLYHVSPWYMVKSLVSLNEWPASYDHLSFSMNRINVITEVVSIFSFLSYFNFWSSYCYHWKKKKPYFLGHILLFYGNLATYITLRGSIEDLKCLQE